MRLTRTTWRRTPIQVVLTILVLLLATMLVGSATETSHAAPMASMASMASMADTTTMAATPVSATSSAAAGSSTSKIAPADLYTAMRALWEQHMEWTYASAAALAAGYEGLPDTVNRLMDNQTDIGNAIKPFYGATAGDALAGLLKTHITDCVAVLVEYQTNGSTTKAYADDVKAAYQNAKDIADLLSSVNPRNWPRAEMESMMAEHITQTVTYAEDMLDHHYAASITDYGQAEAHMLQMSDMLSSGIIAQFPSQFGGTSDVAGH